MSSEEAREIARDNPLSFLHVSKPEIDLPVGIDVHSDAVYEKGKDNFEKLIGAGTLQQDSAPAFYLYRQVMGGHSQVGLVAAASCEDYLAGIIKKHEFTRPDKEDDRVRHIETLNAQTGPVFLVYKSQPAMDEWVRCRTAAAPQIDFTAADGVRHSAWVLADAEDLRLITEAFARLPALYIADGHHRSAAAARVFQSRHGAGQSAWFLSVIFPDNQVQILPYNRVLKDLNGMTSGALWEKLGQVFAIAPGGAGQAQAKHTLGLYIEGRWHTLKFLPRWTDGTSGIASLDVSLLQDRVLAPLFGIADPRTSKRINFVGGIRGMGELEKLVNSGEYACAFSLHPTSIQDLMDIADQGGIMPPKSTWFEPKLRDAMFCHLL
jgi:uncharacterized protein (DUF1015 family)